MCYKIVFLTLLTIVSSRNIDFLTNQYTGQGHGINYGVKVNHDYVQNPDSDTVTTVNPNKHHQQTLHHHENPHRQHHQRFPPYHNQDFHGNTHQVEHREIFRLPDENIYQKTMLFPEEEHRRNTERTETSLHQNQNDKQDLNKNLQKASDSDSQAIDSNKYHINNKNQKNTNGNENIERDSRNENDEAITKNIEDIFQNDQPKWRNNFNKNEDYSKTTEFNEVTPRSKEAKNKKNILDDFKWIWDDNKNNTDVIETTTVVDKVTLDDRAAFAGDKCPTGKVKFNEMCVGEA